ncbi:hypothetical protein FACS189435_4790 [Bacteroidia bacterium]|nr:hypothetical protein FACS189435_4790 [Bacteroidia bacterium]
MLLENTQPCSTFAWIMIADMNKITYIKHLQSEANRKIWNSLIEKYKSIRQRNKLLGFLYLIVSCSIVGIVAIFSWLSMLCMFFKDTRFTLHYMQTVIIFNNMNDSQAVDYLNAKELEYKKRLSYGNVSMKEKNRIETTFELLYRKYKHPESNNEEAITPVLQSINQHTQTVSEYAVWKQTEEMKEIERKQQLQDEQAKRKKSAHNRAKGRMLDSFESALTEEGKSKGIKM